MKHRDNVFVSLIPIVYENILSCSYKDYFDTDFKFGIVKMTQNKN